MLSSFEQRQLRAIERSLESDDPDFAARISTANHSSPLDSGRRQLSIVVMVGVVLVVVGVVVSPLLVVLGVAMTLVGLSVPLALAWVSRVEDAEPRGSDTDGT